MHDMVYNETASTNEFLKADYVFAFGAARVL